MASTNFICTILPIFLCMSIIFCLVVFTFRATAHHVTLQREPTNNNNNNTSPCPEMVLDGASSPDYLTLRTQKDARRKMTNIRNVFLYDERVYIGDEESGLQPLLPGELYDDPLVQTMSDHTVTGQHKNMQKKNSINWHGTNTLNTSWGWMA
ncbi:uncharacterized protein TrAtP1_001730 [Trichoderma atroviride]|uniref:uncharacterized protein n=1 Tax=Hypocrea atroviridis TaxID=63577 RepID=UPI003326BE22|nr:hypothetical protein TrAtP1_001730 [Trichoderma atroviride]